MTFDDVRAEEIVIRDRNVLHLDKNIFARDKQKIRENISPFIFV